MPLETPARSAISWRRALANPHSPKTARAASMICWGLSSGRLRHFGGADFGLTDLVLCIAKQIVTDQSVIYYTAAKASITSYTCVMIPAYLVVASAASLSLK